MATKFEGQSSLVGVKRGGAFDAGDEDDGGYDAPPYLRKKFRGLDLDDD